MVDSEAVRCRVLIVGCNCILRKGFASIVRGVIPNATFAETSRFDEARELLECEEFSAAMFDVDVGELTEPTSFQKLRADYPQLIMGVLSRIDDAGVILKYLAAGVNGYILECSSPTEVECAIEAIFRGAIYVPPSLARSKADQLDYDPKVLPLHRSLKGLTGRQSDVFGLLLDGYSNKEIARELDLSPHTVKIHVGAILRHFAVRRRTDLSIAAPQRNGNGRYRYTALSRLEGPPRPRIVA